VFKEAIRRGGFRRIVYTFVCRVLQSEKQTVARIAVL